MDIKLICILVTFIILKLPIYFMIFLLVKVKRGALCALHMPNAGGAHCADIITQNSSSKGEKYRDTYRIENPVSYCGISVSS